LTQKKKNGNEGRTKGGAISKANKSPTRRRKRRGGGLARLKIGGKNLSVRQDQGKSFWWEKRILLKSEDKEE